MTTTHPDGPSSDAVAPADAELIKFLLFCAEDKFAQIRAVLARHGRAREIAAQPGEGVVLPKGWTVKRSGVEAFVSGPNGGGWLERKGTLWQRTLFDLADALTTSAPPHVADALDGELLRDDYITLAEVESRLETLAEEYEWCDDESQHTITEGERAMLIDFAHGILVDPMFLAMMAAHHDPNARGRPIAARAEAGGES